MYLLPAHIQSFVCTSEPKAVFPAQSISHLTPFTYSQPIYTSAQESSSPVQGPAVQLPARGDFPRQTASCALHHHIPARVARCPQAPFPTSYVPLLYYPPSISFLFTLHHLPFLYTFLHVLLHDPCKKYLKSLIS